MSKWPHEMLTFPRVHGHENIMIYTWYEHEIIHVNFIGISYKYVYLYANLTHFIP